MVCRLSFALVCIIAALGGVLVIGLQVVSASTRAWVHVTVEKTTFSFGLFYLEDSDFVTTLKMVRYTPLVVMQAMLVFSIGFGVAGVITTGIGITQRLICGKGTKFFITLSQIFFAISAVMYLIGIGSFTHSWLKNPTKFFKIVPGNPVFYYGYAYTISWFVVMLQVTLALFLIISVNYIIRRQDKLLAEQDGRADERKRLVEKTASSVVEKAIVEGVTKAELEKESTDSATASTSAATADPEVAGPSH